MYPYKRKVHGLPYAEIPKVDEPSRCRSGDLDEDITEADKVPLHLQLAKRVSLGGFSTSIFALRSAKRTYAISANPSKLDPLAGRSKYAILAT